VKTAIVGTKHYGPLAVAALARLRPGDPVRLVREPYNPEDRNAIAVLSIHGQMLGYIPRERNVAMARTLDHDPKSLVAVIALEAIVENGEVKFAAQIEIKDRLDDLLTRNTDQHCPHGHTPRTCSDCSY
jgi:hypothetical protein